MNDADPTTIDAIGVSTLPNFLNFPSFDDYDGDESSQSRHRRKQSSTSLSAAAGVNNTNDIPRTMLNRRTRFVRELTKDEKQEEMAVHEQQSSAASTALETTFSDFCYEEPPRVDQCEGQSCEQLDGRDEEEPAAVSSSSRCLQHLGRSGSFMAMSMSMKELASPCGLLRRLSLTNNAGTAEASSSRSAPPPAAEPAPLPSSLTNPSCHRTTIRPITRSSFDCLKMPDLPDFMVDQTACGAATGSSRSSCAGKEAAPSSSAATAGASPPRNLLAREERRRKSATTATFDYLATALRLSL